MKQRIAGTVDQDVYDLFIEDVKKHGTSVSQQLNRVLYEYYNNTHSNTNNTNNTDPNSSLLQTLISLITQSSSTSTSTSTSTSHPLTAEEFEERLIAADRRYMYCGDIKLYDTHKIKSFLEYRLKSSLDELLATDVTSIDEMNKNNINHKRLHVFKRAIFKIPTLTDEEIISDSYRKRTDMDDIGDTVRYDMLGIPSPRIWLELQDVREEELNDPSNPSKREELYNKFHEVFSKMYNLNDTVHAGPNLFDYELEQIFKFYENNIII